MSDATVFTNELQEMKKLREQALLKIRAVEPELYGAQCTAQEASIREGVTGEMRGHCWENYNDKWNFYFVFEREIKCRECHEEAVKQMDIKLAEKCCIEQIADLEEHAKEDLAIFKKCIDEVMAAKQTAAKKGTKRGREEWEKNEASV